MYFKSGADKVSIGSDAVTAAEEYYAARKQLFGNTAIEQISGAYGNQAVVISVDPKESMSQTQPRRNIIPSRRVSRTEWRTSLLVCMHDQRRTRNAGSGCGGIGDGSGGDGSG